MSQIVQSAFQTMIARQMQTKTMRSGVQEGSSNALQNVCISETYRFLLQGCPVVKMGGFARLPRI